MFDLNFSWFFYCQIPILHLYHPELKTILKRQNLSFLLHPPKPELVILENLHQVCFSAMERFGRFKSKGVSLFLYLHQVSGQIWHNPLDSVPHKTMTVKMPIGTTASLKGAFKPPWHWDSQYQGLQ